MRPTRWRYGLLILVIAAGIAVLTRVSCDWHPVVPAPTAKTSGVGPPRSGSLSRPPVRTALEFPPAAAESLRVSVLTESGQPIPGALVGFYDGRARTLEPGEDAAGTNSLGVAELRWDAAGARTAVATWAEGWRPASASVEPGQADLVLRLARGLIQRITVTDVWGAPIAGATATLSRAGLADSAVGTAGLATSSPQAVHRATSDTSGSITFSDLSPGEFYYIVSANGYIPREQPDGRLSVPGEDIGVVLEPLGGILADVADGAVLAYAIRPPEVVVLEHARPPGQGEWMRQSAAWSRRFPGAISMLAAVVPERRDALRSAGLPAGIAAFVAGCGWGVGVATIRLLPEVDGPERLQLDWRGGSKLVQLALVAPDGTRVEEGKLQVRCATPLEGLETAFEVALGEAIELPLGPCSLQGSRLPVSFGVGDGEFFVSETSDRIDVPILGPCREVEVRVRLPDGTSPNGARRALARARGKRSRQAARLAGRLRPSRGHALWARLHRDRPHRAALESVRTLGGRGCARDRAGWRGRGHSVATGGLRLLRSAGRPGVARTPLARLRNRLGSLRRLGTARIRESGPSMSACGDRRGRAHSPAAGRCAAHREPVADR